MQYTFTWNWVFLQCGFSTFTYVKNQNTFSTTPFKPEHVFFFACHDYDCYFQQDNPYSTYLNNEALGIEMGTEISNLSHSIDIRYTGVNMVKKKDDWATNKLISV